MQAEAVLVEGIADFLVREALLVRIIVLLIRETEFEVIDSQ